MINKSLETAVKFLYPVNSARLAQAELISKGSGDLTCRNQHFRPLSAEIVICHSQ